MLFKFAKLYLTEVDFMSICKLTAETGGKCSNGCFIQIYVWKKSALTHRFFYLSLYEQLFSSVTTSLIWNRMNIQYLCLYETMHSHVTLSGSTFPTELTTSKKPTYDVGVRVRKCTPIRLEMYHVCCCHARRKCYELVESCATQQVHGLYVTYQES